MATPSADAARTHDPYAALRLRDYRLFLTGSTLAWVGVLMESTAVGWDIYERTHDPLALGLVGLVQIIPGVALALPAGHLADRVDRRRVLLAAYGVLCLGSLALTAASVLRGDVWLMYVCLFFIGVARAIQQPAKSAFLPQLVPRELFSNAVTWNSSAFQISAIAGPALAGMAIAAAASYGPARLTAHAAAPVYVLNALGSLAFVGCLLMLRPRPIEARGSEEITLQSLMAGFRFVWKAKIVLASITLDMFAVLLGGAVALIPVYAEDILRVGPRGLGWLNAAPAVGALLTSLVLAHRPPMKKAGRALLWTVAGFGASTVVFGWSRSFSLSLLMLFLNGATDMVSVIIRHTLVQTMTPDAMRGRVSAVNGIFIGLSNELGAFESGAVAKVFERPGDPAFGPTVSVITGGFGTLLVVGVVALLLPQVRAFGRLDTVAEPPPATPPAGMPGVQDLSAADPAPAPPAAGGTDRGQA